MPYIKRHQRKIYVNIVPLVDVLIVLLFFFIATSQFKQFKVLNIKVPEMKTAGVNQIEEQISIAIDKSGQLFFNNVLVSNQELNDALIVARKVMDDRSIIIMADEATEVKVITEVMDLCRTNQFNKISLQARLSNE